MLLHFWESNKNHLAESQMMILPATFVSFNIWNKDHAVPPTCVAWLLFQQMTFQKQDDNFDILIIAVYLLIFSTNHLTDHVHFSEQKKGKVIGLKLKNAPEQWWLLQGKTKSCTLSCFPSVFSLCRKSQKCSQRLVSYSDIHESEKSVQYVCILVSIQ